MAIFGRHSEKGNFMSSPIPSSPNIPMQSADSAGLQQSSKSFSDSLTKALKGDMSGLQNLDNSENSYGSEDAYDSYASQEVDPNNPMGDEPSSEAPEQSPPTEEAQSTEQSPQEQGAPNVLEVVVTDEEGKRKKIKVDLNDKDKVKKLTELAHGARKWQAERDKAQSKLKEIEPAYTELKKTWDVIEKAYSEHGVRGLINVLEGKEDAYDSLLQSEFQKVRMREEATPAELERLELQERWEKESREREKFARRLEEMETRQAQEKEQAELQALQSQINPAFEKHRVAGKLGDEVLEANLDELIWNKTISNLQNLPEGVQISQGLIEREFKQISELFLKRFNAKAETKAKEVIEQKKVSAATKVSAAATNSQKQHNSQSQLNDLVRKGSTVDLVKAWLKGGK